MRSALIIALLFASPMIPSARGQERSFPYEAVVEAEEAMARSGPGRSYYPTGKLSSGDRVMVHRHDPGGWYMIAPPPGSFSWIRAEYVSPSPRTPLPEGEGPGVRARGVLTANNVVVRVGSAFGEQREVEQKRLSTGEEVEILGEKTFATESGPVRMYKIKPPQGEFRWVQGQFLVPVDQTSEFTSQRSEVRGQKSEVRSQGAEVSNQKTFSREPQVSADSTFSPQPPTLTVEPQADSEPSGPNDAVLNRGPSAGETNVDRKRLEELDDRFRAMIERPTAQWDFTPLETGYQTLQKETSHPALAAQIDLRLAALKRYQAIKREYDEFVQITEETSRRDAHLASLQHKNQSHPKRPAHGNPAPGPIGPSGRPSGAVVPPASGIPSPFRNRPLAVPPQPAVPHGLRAPRRRAVPPGVRPHGPQLMPGPTMPAPGPHRPTSKMQGPHGRPTYHEAQRPVQTLHRNNVLPQTGSHALRGNRSSLPRSASFPRRAWEREKGRGRPVQAGFGGYQPGFWEKLGLSPGTPRRKPPLPPSSQTSRSASGQVGIVQRAAVTVPGAPPYVLTSSNGRILAYLQPGPGVSLGGSVGRPMRVAGPRSHHQGLKTDVIVVRSLTPAALSSR